MQLVNGEDSINIIVVDKLQKNLTKLLKRLIKKDVLSMLQSLADKGFIINDGKKIKMKLLKNLKIKNFIPMLCFVN